ncbi:cytochrome c oxidase subunit 3 [Knoellia remsis]|uniref:aa3-type cytochrome oxidase subunit III n=1 Tax=Knoellia remsis TaxID=407159 RepID=UPI000D07130E|nr:heme-copper oxidase subunit III [Knoellia remsis]
MTGVATAEATNRVSGPVPSIPDYGPATRPNMVAVGTMVWLSSELMFFAALFAFYFSLRGTLPTQWAERSEMLNVPFAFANTIILVISSIWCQLGVWRAERGQVARTGSLLQVKQWGMREWYVLTYIFGSIFIAGQVYEYAKLVSEGVTLSTDSYSSIFYLATGFHGIHVTGGLIAFLLIIGRTFTTRRYTHLQETGAVVTSYYWHFVDVVWIALFAMIYLLK